MISTSRKQEHTKISIHYHFEFHQQNKSVDLLFPLGTLYLIASAKLKNLQGQIVCGLQCWILGLPPSITRVYFKDNEVHIKEWNFNFSRSSYNAWYSSINSVLSHLANISSSPTDNNSKIMYFITSSQEAEDKIVLYNAKKIWTPLSLRFQVYNHSNPPFYLFKYRCNKFFKKMSTTRSQRKAYEISEYEISL